jgi:hypothetical protein
VPLEVIVDRGSEDPGPASPVATGSAVEFRDYAARHLYRDDPLD